MIATKGYAAHSSEGTLSPHHFERRTPTENDVHIAIKYCGVCHSDLHQIKNEWGGAVYPMVPGHEIVGEVVAVGANVKKFKVGDLAGVGCFVDSCRTCANCQEGLEQYCLTGHTQTYNSPDLHDTAPVTYGGYSNAIVVDEAFTLKVSNELPLDAVAPLLCAGITTYSPLRHWKVGKGHKVAVLGLGGLGHMAVKFAVAFGAEVTMLSTSPSKEADAKKLGAHHFVLTSDEQQVAKVQHHFDFILDTVSAEHDYGMYLNMLKTNGAMVCVGAPPTPAQISAFQLIMGRKTLAGSLVGGLPETQEMLDFCAAHKIVSEIELIKMADIHEAYERMLKGDVRYRFVIDMATL